MSAQLSVRPVSWVPPDSKRFDPQSLFWGSVAHRFQVASQSTVVDLSPLGVMRAGGMSPDEWQAEILDDQHRTILVTTCRQAGKSTTAVSWCLSKAASKEGQTIIVASPSFRQSARILARARVHYRRCVKHWEGALVPTITNRSIESVQMDNGSQILALPATPETIRGETAHAALFEEAAFMPLSVRDVVSPMLASTDGQRLVITSAGIQGSWMHSDWLDVDAPHVSRVEVPYQRVPRISPEFIASERRRMTKATFDREYCCVWSQSDGAVFNAAAVSALIRPEVAPIALPEFSWEA